MKLVTPDIKYKNSFLEALEEYRKEPPTNKHMRNDYYNSLSKEELENDFGSYIAKVNSYARGENLPEGYVPETTYWLIDKGEFIGRVNVRHILNDYLLREAGHIGYDIRPSKRGKGYGKIMLKLALGKAQELDIKKVLITCSVNNIASKKLIEANGGVFENSLTTRGDKPDKLRYWIDI